jgi:hypothetical protein
MNDLLTATIPWSRPGPLRGMREKMVCVARGVESNRRPTSGGEAWRYRHNGTYRIVTVSSSGRCESVMGGESLTLSELVRRSVEGTLGGGGNRG